MIVFSPYNVQWFKCVDVINLNNYRVEKNQPPPPPPNHQIPFLTHVMEKITHNINPRDPPCYLLDLIMFSWGKKERGGRGDTNFLKIENTLEKM
jgi:hypothetical protein